MDNLTSNKYERHIKYLLGQVHIFQMQQYQGDYGAVVILTDLETAIKSAMLTNKQREALRLVYVIDLTQGEAAIRLGVSQQAVDMAVNAGVRKIAHIYKGWAGKEVKRKW